jgi:mRNA-degrading endonuclease RelE of RelBE toxin-antitoxin system
MRLNFSRQAEKQFRKLPDYLKKKARKQFHFLLDDYRHPSLRTKRMEGLTRFEARIDRHYRFTFEVFENEIFILSVGPHDEGLGKK